MVIQFINIMIIETFVAIVLVLYSVYLNLRIKDLEDDCDSTHDILFHEINEFMDFNRDVKKRLEALEKKKVAKPRRRSTKTRSKVSTDKAS